MSIAAVSALSLLLAACADEPQSALDPQGPFAERPDDLFQIVFWIAVAIFILVQGLIVFAVVRFREKPGDTTLPAQVHGNTKLEIFWTLVPALILAGIAVPTVQMIFELDAEPEGSYTIEVIGHRWWFEYRYPTTAEGEAEVVTANEMTIPVGVPIRLVMTAEEAGGLNNAVIHSFWIPKLGGKQDVVPGRINTLNIQADEPGYYLGACAEFCGLSHANMRARVVALEPAEFDRWLADQQREAEEPVDGLAAQGKELFLENACAACHAIAGTEAQGQIGPNLTHLMSRREFAGAIYDLYFRAPDGEFLLDEPHIPNLTAWVRNAPAMKAMRPEFGIGMPSFEDSLTDDEVDAIVAYLLTLE